MEDSVISMANLSEYTADRKKEKGTSEDTNQPQFTLKAEELIG